MIEPDPAEIRSRLVILEQVELLFMLPRARIRSVARQATRRRVRTGEIVVREGERGEQVYVIADGRCEVRTSTGAGKSMATAVLHRADLFGISALTPADPHFATVVAVTDTDLLEIERADLFLAVASVPEVLADVMRVVDQRRFAMKTAGEGAFGELERGKVVAVYSTKGGAGKTTFAVNLGAVLARESPGEVALLDLGLPYNHAALLSGMVPDRSLALLDQVRPTFEEELLSSTLRHPSGLMLIPGTVRLEQAELITGEIVAHSLGVLRHTFRAIVVDLGVTLGDPALQALETADRVVLLVTPEVATVKDAREALAIFTDVLRIPVGKIHVLLNHPREAGTVSRASIENALGVPVEMELPCEGRKFDRAALRGELLALIEPTSGIGRLCARAAGILELDGQRPHRASPLR